MIGAVILAGGQGSRLGGVRKAELRVDGETLLERVLDACRGCTSRVVVGFPDLIAPAGVTLVQEDPPGSGPAAALAAGVDALDPDVTWVLGLACDQPGVGTILPALIDAAGEAAADVESVFAATPASMPPEGQAEGIKWLTGIHRVSALRRLIVERGPAGLINGSMRQLFAPATYTTIQVDTDNSRDIDTWADHQHWLEKLGHI